MTDRSLPPRTQHETIEIRVPGANCPSCFNDALDRIRGLAGVIDVQASIHDQCIEVQHDGVPTGLLVDTLRTYLHGTDDSSHECQMVAVEPEPITAASVRAHATTPPRTRVEAAEPMETLLEATRRLHADGFLTDFAASPEGNLVCRSCRTSQDPENIDIVETVRFEGDSNPDDEAILLALRCADGCLGLYSAAFGSNVPSADVMALRRLS